MKVTLKTICVNIPQEMNKTTTVEIADNSTVEQALKELAEMKSIDLAMLLDKTIFLVAKRSVAVNHPLSDGDEIMVLRSAEGG